MRLQSSEALVGLDHAGRDPSQGHTGIPLAFDVAGDAANCTYHVLRDVGNRYEILGADVRLRFRDRGVWCDHPRQRHREHEVRAGRPCTLSCELVLVDGRLCDSPGCAESADP